MISGAAADGDQHLNNRLNRNMLHNSIKNRLSLGQNLDNQNDRYIKVFEKYEDAANEEALEPIK